MLGNSPTMFPFEPPKSSLDNLFPKVDGETNGFGCGMEDEESVCHRLLEVWPPVPLQSDSSTQGLLPGPNCASRCVCYKLGQCFYLECFIVLIKNMRRERKFASYPNSVYLELFLC